MPALGDVINFANAKRTIIALNAVAGAVAIPTLATDGIANYPQETVYGSDTGACYATMGAKQSTVAVLTVGGTTPSTKVNLWGYLSAGSQDKPTSGPGKWFLIRSLNAGAAIGVTAGLGQIQYSEQITNLGHWDRLAVELNTVTGTLAALSVYITTDRGITT